MVLEQTYSYKCGKRRRTEYKCPCGKGLIVEENRRVYIDCPECERKYYLDMSRGIHRWRVEERSNDCGRERNSIIQAALS